MTDPAPGFVFRGVYCYPRSDDPEAFTYVPGDPSPVQDQGGRPQLTLGVSDQGAILQLGTQWTVDEPTFEALREHIVERFGELDIGSSQVRLMPAMAQIEGVVLAIGDGTGKLEEVMTVDSSGFSPYTALFNVQLTAEQEALVVGALNGDAGFAKVTYWGSLPGTVPMSTSIMGDASKEVTSLRKAVLGRNPTLADARTRLDGAIAAGRLRVSHARPTGAPEGLLRKAEEQAREIGAMLLLKMARQGSPAPTPDSSAFSVTASLTETSFLPLERSTDVSSWFADGNGSDHVRVLPTTIPDPAEPEGLAVRLGFRAEEVPISFVKVTQDRATQGTAKIILHGPDFGPVTLPGGEGVQPVAVKTYYTDGGPPFETEVVSPEATEASLAPQVLGLAKVAVDGTARRESGAREVRVRVQYMPSGEGTADERTLLLGGDEWTASFYVITRDTGIAGTLRYGWKETAASGSTVTHPPVATESPEVKL